MKRNITANYSEQIIKSEFTAIGETLISSAALVKVKGKAKSVNTLVIKEASTNTTYTLGYGEETPLLDGSQGIYCTKDAKEPVVSLTITEYTFSSYSEVGNGSELSSKVGKYLNPVQEPQTAPTGTGGDAGVLNGTYTYMCTFVTANGETEGRIQSEDVTVTNKKINLSAIPISTDSRVIARNIYRKPAAYSSDVVPLKFLVQIADNTTTTYVDNIADASLGDLVNRINTTGGQIFSNNDPIFSADTTNLSIGWDSNYLGKGYASTAIGIHTLPNNYGQRNTAVGMYSLAENTSGNNNTAVGVHALNDQTTANDNVAVGYTAAQKNITGISNVAVGSGAAQNATGSSVTAVGKGALNASTTGNNTAVGFNALGNITAGQSNLGVGRNAGAYLENGSTKAVLLTTSTLIGDNCKVLNSNDTNTIVIGYNAVGAGANTCVIGNTSITKTVLRGDITLDKTVTAGGTTGSQTINKPTGTVNFAAGAASLVVTNSLVTANSIITLTVGTNDATMKSALAVAASGSFTIYPDANPTAETRVNFLITN